jgi:hypothetical protein
MGGAAVDMDDGGDSDDDDEYAGLANIKNQKNFKKNFHTNFNKNLRDTREPKRVQRCRYHPGREVYHSSSDCHLNPVNASDTLDKDPGQSRRIPSF